MTSEDYRRAKDHVYGLAHNVCESGTEQAQLVDVLREIETVGYKNGMKNIKIIKQMLFPIMDGLQFGNWPWTKK